MASAVHTTNDQNVLIAGISAIMDIPLKSSSSSGRGSVEPEKVSLLDYHDKTYSYGQVGDTVTDPGTSTKKDSNRTNQKIEVYAKTLNGRDITVHVDPNETVEIMTNTLQNSGSIPSNQERLVYAGRTLNSEKRLSEYGIQNRCTVHILQSLQDGVQTVLDPKSMNPRYDYDFTDIKDDKREFTRGSMRYVRPCGWKRFAINVSNKFENMTWLGQSDKDGEWPVSYHGTGSYQARTIAMDGFELSKGRQYAYGYGIYSTPDLKIAEQYAVKFSHNNDQYLIVLQNRVNPKTLINISADQNGADEYWVSPNDKDIRPYGICIRKL